MAKNQKDTLLIAVLVFLFVLVFFGGFGMMGFGEFGGMMGGYGNNYMCSHMGGIWCYWPSFGWIINILIVVALVLFIIWIVKQIQNGNGGKRR